MEQAQNHSARTLELVGWPVKVASYRLGKVYYATVDNVSPGAWIARGEGATQAEAETKALAVAHERLARARRVAPLAS